MESSENHITAENVKACWTKIKNEKGIDSFIDDFYHFMFEHHPETRTFFPENLQAQKTSLLSTLDNVINGIEYIEDLEQELMSLGQHHKNMGIKKDMFNAFITTIVATANSSSNFTLSDKELLAWENAFKKISHIMLKAY